MSIGSRARIVAFMASLAPIHAFGLQPLLDPSLASSNFAEDPFVLKLAAARNAESLGVSSASMRRVVAGWRDPSNPGSADGTGKQCTGTFVTQTLFLTAAHCFDTVHGGRFAGARSVNEYGYVQTSIGTGLTIERPHDFYTGAVTVSQGRGLLWEAKDADKSRAGTPGLGSVAFGRITAFVRDPSYVSDVVVKGRLPEHDLVLALVQPSTNGRGEAQPFQAIGLAVSSVPAVQGAWASETLCAEPRSLCNKSVVGVPGTYVTQMYNPHNTPISERLPADLDSADRVGSRALLYPIGTKWTQNNAALLDVLGQVDPNTGKRLWWYETDYHILEQGDSGSPLYAVKGDGGTVLAGVLSMGAALDPRAGPTVWTDVGSFRSWYELATSTLEAVEKIRPGSERGFEALPFIAGTLGGSARAGVEQFALADFGRAWLLATLGQEVVIQLQDNFQTAGSVRVDEVAIPLGFESLIQILKADGNGGWIDAAAIADGSGAFALDAMGSVKLVFSSDMAVDGPRSISISTSYVASGEAIGTAAFSDSMQAARVLVTISAVPETSTIVMLAAGAGLLAWRVRKGALDSSPMRS
jgi:hypothetical protein